MQEEKVVFVTGVTGYVGCHLAYELLKDGHTVVTLVRTSGRRRAPEVRAQQAIAAVDENHPVSFDKLIVIPGDVQDNSEEIMGRIREHSERPFNEIWHCVATFKFTEEERDEIVETNIEGVRHMLEMVLNINGDGEKPRYFHVSTAYSSGREEGIVPEDFVRHGNEFRSLYEWSKHEGEALVAKYQKEHNLDVTIFRPAIIVGSPTTKVISYSAYYQVCEALYRLKKRQQNKMGDAYDGLLDIRLPGRINTKVNFVPIDYVTEAMLLIAAEPELENRNLKVFNIVNENPPEIRLIHRIFCETLGVHGIRIVSDDQFMERGMNSMERVMARSIAFQAPYMMEEMHFATDKFRQYVSEEQLPPLHIDEHFLAAINKIFFNSLDAAAAENGK